MGSNDSRGREGDTVYSGWTLRRSGRRPEGNFLRQTHHIERIIKQRPDELFPFNSLNRG